MSDDSNSPADLSNMGIDLSQIFRPSWTVDSSDSTAKLAARFDDGDRFDRPDRKSGQHRGDDRGRGPRTGQGRDRDSRGPRPQSAGGNRDSKGGPGGGGGGQRGNRDAGRGRDARGPRQEDRRPEPVDKPVLEGWKIGLIPQASALEGISKQIRSRAKTYPLFELARLIIQLSDRYLIRLTAEGEASPELFRAKLDDSLWTSRKGAISHLLSKHLEKFYRRSSITVDAPKGSYSVVAQCGMSGVLLGPPNHHEYQSRLLALHATRFKNLPFEVYKARIKMMRDEALMEQWKSEQSTRTVYIPIEPEAEQELPVAPEAVPADEQLPASEVVIEPPSAVETEGVTPGEAPSEETAPVTESSAVTESTEEAPAAEVSEAAETVAEELPASSEEISENGLTLEEATAHFNEHHAALAVEPAGTDITVSGRVALHESDPLLHELLIKTLQELDRFPLPLAQIIGKELTSAGLQIFKAQKKIIHVSVARPRYLDRSTTPTSEGFRKILDYLEAHPNQHRDKQWAGMLAQITEPAGEEAEAVQRREQALGTDLISLLHQGHILDFAMGNLQAALRPVPKQAATPQIEKAPKAPSVDASSEPEPTPSGEMIEATIAEKSVEEIAEETSAEAVCETVLPETPKTVQEPAIVEAAVEPIVDPLLPKATE